MKTAKKLTALLLAVVMVLAMSVSAFAATTDTGLSGTVTVKFTKNYSDTDDGVYTWNATRGEDLFTTNSSVTVKLATLNGVELSVCKAYYSEPTTNAMYNTVSVLDVVMAAAASSGHTPTGNWDADPDEGLPGGYLYNVDNQEFESYYGENGDGTYWMMGTGFVIGVASNASAEPTFSTSYLSNVAASTLSSGAVIYVDLGNYTFSSVTW